VANYHLAPKSIARGQGRSACAAAAYRAGEAIDDARTGVRHDYTRKGGVLHSEIIAPDGAPAWAYDRSALWNAVEAAEDKSTRRDTAKTAREFEVSLPHELDAEQRQAAGLEFARYLVDTYGVVADVSFHAPHPYGDGRNWHVHILTTTRTMGEDGFGGKVRELDSPKTSGAHIVAIREQWANIANRHLEAAGREERIDHRSYADQGRDQEATIHLGPDAAAMERKGEQTELGNINRTVKAANDDRARLEAEAAEVSAQIIDLEEERAKRAAQKEVFAAARTLDPARVLDAITERRATFTRADLNFALSKQITDAKERSAFMNEILGHGETVALADEEGGAISRYTTRGVLRAEADVFDAGRNLAADHSHGIRSDRLAACIDGHHELDQEQRAAVAHATHAEGLAIIAGEAGTGKSRTMAAIRDAYEAEGKHVIGMAWTNAVVQDMAASGFDHTTTIKGELMRLEGGYTSWDRDTVVMVDEAGMLATKHLAELMGRAEEAGAKLILVGDDKQLASIEHGGMFGALKEEHGAAELHTVRRVADADQKTAFNAMHRGDFRAALDVFKDRGAIHWTEGEDATQAALVESYAQASAQEPGKTRFAFAYTNAEVDALNSAIRQKREERGELGEDHVFATKHGDQVFAEGDRVQFTGNAADRERKAAGLVNGMVGTVEAIKDAEMTVRLDAKQADGSDRVVTFRVGTDEQAGEFGAIRHGYAGTIYKGQGKTLDETFVLHSRHWRSASSYVALTRHREDVTLFVDKAESRDLDRLAVQMSRIEEKRAASGFHQVETPEAERPLFAGRYAALHDAHAAGEAEQRGRAANQNDTAAGDQTADAARKPQDGAARAAEQIPAPENEEAQAAARQAARAQWIAARTEKIMDGRKQGLRLQRYHRDDRLAEPQPIRPEESGGAAELPRLPDHLDRYREQLEERRADMDQAEAAYAAAQARLAEKPDDMAIMFEISRRSIAAERTREPGQAAEQVLTRYAELRREEPAKAVAYLERSYQQEERAELARHRERGARTR